MEPEEEVIIQEQPIITDVELYTHVGTVNVYNITGAGYTHIQNDAANDWVIVHNLGYIPSQEKTLDSANEECFGSERINETINGFIQRWPGGQFSGKTILS